MINGLQDATLVFSFESNLAFECQHLIHAVQAAGIKRWLALKEGAQGGIGWLTTNSRKESMCLQLREALRVGNICYAAEFFSITSTAKEAKDTLESEIKNFSVIVEAPNSAFGKTKKTYSGKQGGHNDDLCIGLQLAIAGIKCFYAEAKYQNFRPVN